MRNEAKYNYSDNYYTTGYFNLQIHDIMSRRKVSNNYRLRLPFVLSNYNHNEYNLCEYADYSNSILMSQFLSSTNESNAFNIKLTETLKIAQ